MIEGWLTLVLADHWPKIAAASVTIWVTGWWIASARRINANKKKIARKQKAFAEKKRLIHDHLTRGQNQPLITEKRKDILGHSFEKLLHELRDGTLDPVEVLEAYQAKALSETDWTNCVCDFIDECNGWAKALREVPPSERGPLYGLPVSLKECFYVQGYDTTAGMARWIEKPREQDGPLVTRLKKMGAVPFCLTNVPQTMLSYGCSNPVYGVTCHPKDPHRTPGGSSGGEACLIAGGGSILGVGSDVGGSLRIPAHFCGVVGMKPTSGRIYEGGRVYTVRPGVGSNAGFMCRKVEGVTTAMKALLQDAKIMSREDPLVVPLNWQSNLYHPGRKLRVGWYDDSDFMVAVPGVRRAVKVVAELLEKDGHTVIHFQPPHLAQLCQDFFRFMLADLGKNSLEVWKDEVLDQSIEVNNLVYKVPFIFRRTVFKWVFDWLMPSMGKVAPCGLWSTADLWKGLEDSAIRKREILKAWRDLDLDVLIAPGFGTPSMPVKDPARLVPLTAYTNVYNVLDLPAGSLPVEVYTQDDQVAMESYPLHEDLLYRVMKAGTEGTDTGRHSAVGLPLNVQVIGKPWEEEMVLHAMEIIEGLAQFDKKYDHEAKWWNQ